MTKIKMIKTQKDAIVLLMRELIDRADLQERIIAEKKLPWENEK